VKSIHVKFGKQSSLKLGIIILLALCLMVTMYLFSMGQLNAGLPLLMLPFVLIFVSLIFMKPEIGFWSAFVANYFVMGLARYLPGPLGLAVDGLLVLTWLALYFSQFNKKVEWKIAWNSLTILSILWFLYALFELVNPEAVSREAWFYAMRGVSLYMLLTIPLTFILLGHKKNLDLMLRLWAWFTLLAVGKGIMQKVIGPDHWEKYWLDTVGGKTHLLPQGLRVFSFFTDAATYGGAMGFSGVTFSLIALYTKNLRTKLFFGTIAAAAFYGMIISGTRGALAVPFAGFALYAILSKKIKILAIGGLLIFSVFALLKFTTIGNNVYDIRRIRGGLDKNNDSFQVRLDNQQKLKVYLASRPFGGGIGSAGNWGLRFSPGTFLAETPTDSWYVQIWAEQGVVGLLLHIGILIFVLVSGGYIIMFKLQNPELKGKAMALSAGMFGIMAASYGSGALGQMPNGIIVYMSMAFIYMMPGWEKREAL
jgi:hypothetical protein